LLARLARLLSSPSRLTVRRLEPWRFATSYSLGVHPMPLYANRPSRSSRSRKRQCLSSESDVPCQACLRTWSAGAGPVRIADPPLSFRPWAGRAGRTACFMGQRWLSPGRPTEGGSRPAEAFGELGLGGEKTCAGAGQGKEMPSRVVELNSSRGARHGPAAGQEGWASEWTPPARARTRAAAGGDRAASRPRCPSCSDRSLPVASHGRCQSCWIASSS
jgi:hypothetical protein